MAPELYTGKVRSYAQCDIYSFGILLYEIWFQKIPYSDQKFSHVAQFHNAVSNDGIRPKIPEHESGLSLDVAMVSVMQWCWKVCPSLRPESFQEIKKALKHMLKLLMNFQSNSGEEIDMSETEDLETQIVRAVHDRRASNVVEMTEETVTMHTATEEVDTVQEGNEWTFDSVETEEEWGDVESEFDAKTEISER
jgi:hypothetical protein